MESKGSKHKFRRGLAVLALGTGIVGAVGNLESCATALGTAFTIGFIGGLANTAITSSPGSYTRFLTCNEWIDKNNNGRVDPFEYAGVKDTFRANERITLVAEISSPMSKGAIFKAQLVDGNGNNIYTPDEVILPFEDNVIRENIPPWELYNLGGQGTYSAHFYLNNNLIGIKNFTLVN